MNIYAISSCMCILLFFYGTPTYGFALPEGPTMILLPSELIAADDQVAETDPVCSVQVVPESVLKYTFCAVLLLVTTIVLPSSDTEQRPQKMLGSPETADKFTPPFVLTMGALLPRVMITVNPSAEHATELIAAPAAVVVQFAPVSEDLLKFETFAATPYIRVPSELIATDDHAPVGDAIDHVDPPSVEYIILRSYVVGPFEFPAKTTLPSELHAMDNHVASAGDMALQLSAVSVDL